MVVSETQSSGTSRLAPILPKITDNQRFNPSYTSQNAFPNYVSGREPSQDSPIPEPNGGQRLPSFREIDRAPPILPYPGSTRQSSLSFENDRASTYTLSPPSVLNEPRPNSLASKDVGSPAHSRYLSQEHLSPSKSTLGQPYLLQENRGLRPYGGFGFAHLHGQNLPISHVNYKQPSSFQSLDAGSLQQPYSISQLSSTSTRGKEEDFSSNITPYQSQKSLGDNFLVAPKSRSTSLNTAGDFGDGEDVSKFRGKSHAQEEKARRDEVKFQVSAIERMLRLFPFLLEAGIKPLHLWAEKTTNRNTPARLQMQSKIMVALLSLSYLCSHLIKSRQQVKAELLECEQRKKRQLNTDMITIEQYQEALFEENQYRTRENLVEWLRMQQPRAQEEGIQEYEAAKQQMMDEEDEKRRQAGKGTKRRKRSSEHEAGMRDKTYRSSSSLQRSQLLEEPAWQESDMELPSSRYYQRKRHRQQ